MLDPKTFDGDDDYKLIGGWVLLIVSLICVMLIFGFGFLIGSALG